MKIAFVWLNGQSFRCDVATAAQPATAFEVIVYCVFVRGSVILYNAYVYINLMIPLGYIVWLRLKNNFEKVQSIKIIAMLHLVILMFGAGDRAAACNLCGFDQLY